ncbi:Hypothetical predicted protein [Octopus vulgaris]|uniref:SBF1/SBF2 domain-containing protein n=1 Tax=Octopus vulgaris TaxID=6645 RepID=A0AA36BQK0_OCTVU|nr:Hypothetical predicted protein [Octopus vulgaris]
MKRSDKFPTRTNCISCIDRQFGSKTAVAKCFLYTFLREQPIWHSLRFWNAAFFDAVQCERARRPVCTSEEASEEKVDDSEFQENVTFGQLGTFTCNMKSFGLSRELCFEFLRKQSTIANLSREKQRLLKENILHSKDN